MVQDATGMWEGQSAPAPAAAGSVGPGELPLARPARSPADEPWKDPPEGPSTRAPEHATGHTLDVVA